MEICTGLGPARLWLFAVGTIGMVSCSPTKGGLHAGQTGGKRHCEADGVAGAHRNEPPDPLWRRGFAAKEIPQAKALGPRRPVAALAGVADAGRLLPRTAHAGGVTVRPRAARPSSA